MARRFYIGKKEPDEFAGDLEEWICDKIPPAPPGQVCECDENVHAHESEPDANGNVEIVPCRERATTYLYQIKGNHVCYTYVCELCGEQAVEDYLADQDYPTTGDGYAVVPAHCVE